MEFSKELLAKAKAAASVEELVKLAAENGVSMSREELEAKYQSMHGNGALSDDELDNVSGGCGGGGSDNPQPAMKGYDDYCSNFTRRGGGAGGEYVKFFTGTHCESCQYFKTSSTGGFMDPNYGGVGYCFYGIE